MLLYNASCACAFHVKWLPEPGRLRVWYEPKMPTAFPAAGLTMSLLMAPIAPKFTCEVDPSALPRTRKLNWNWWAHEAFDPSKGTLQASPACTCVRFVAGSAGGVTGGNVSWGWGGSPGS